jgi:hypothetical protein
MSSDSSAVGKETNVNASTAANVPSADSSDSAGKRPLKQSATSAALWSYSKQWSSKGFSRVFSKVFGPSNAQAKDAAHEKKSSGSQHTAFESEQSPLEGIPTEKGEQPTESPVAAKVVELTDVDLTSDNQDIAVQTLMNLKRHAPSLPEPSQDSRNPTAKQIKITASSINEKKVDSRKLLRKNRSWGETPPTHREFRPKKEVLYRPLSVNDLVTKRQEILSAVALVTRTLMSGSYPSPYKTSEVTTKLADDSASTTLHMTHMSAVCASLEKFTNDIIIPSFVGELHSTLVPESIDAEVSIGSETGASENRSTGVNDTSNLHDNVLRAFFGTLLLLREVLVQNFDNVFGPYAASGLPIGDQIALSKNDVEIDNLSKQIFVTAIILTGISIFFGDEGDDGSRDQSEELIQAFFKCVWNYEYVFSRYMCALRLFIIVAHIRRMRSDSRGHSEFVNCLQIVGGDTVAVFPNQQQMNDVERVAWQLSCNFQRSLHPLYRQAINRLPRSSIVESKGQSHGDLEGHQNGVMHVPTPTAVHISILKIQSKSSTPDSRM